MLYPPPAQVCSLPKKDMSGTGLPEFADDTITDYSRHSPSVESNTSDLQNCSSSVSEHGESSDSIMSKPMIKFVKAGDNSKIIKTNIVETARKAPVKYAEMYRNTSKSPNVRGNQRKNWSKNNFAHKNVTPRADLFKTALVSAVRRVNTAAPRPNSNNNLIIQGSRSNLWEQQNNLSKLIKLMVKRVPKEGKERTKSGDRFGFVRFIHIKDVYRLVKNLCTLRMGRLRLHDNVARFQRPPLNKARHVKGANVGQKSFGVSSNIKKPKNDNKEEESSKATLKYPPDFTPNDVLRTKDVQVVDDVVEVQENTQKSNKQDNFTKDNNVNGVTHSKEEDKESFCSGQFRRSVGPQTGGSILQVMEDLYLVISVYAPQEASEKRMLWSYLNHMIDRWDGESILMGDFNEVRHKEERIGSIFNNHNAMVFNSFISSSGLVETRSWIGDKKESATTKKAQLKGMLKDIDILIDEKKVDQELLNKRMNVINSIHDLEKLEATQIAQKAKIKWSIEGDENSKFFHGILNKKRNQHAIRGILSEGNWIEDPNSVNNAFFSHFKERYDSPCSSRLMLEGEFPNKLRADQSIDLESNVTIKEIKRVVWDCGIDKSPRPDGFTFGFYRRYWDIIKKDVADAVSFFFISGNFPKGGNSSFIALIPKMQDAKVVKDYRPISLIGSLYKIIAKILANRLVGGFWRAYDSVRRDYLDDVLNKFGFGSKWRNWIHNCLNSSKVSILVNESPTGEFQFRKGLKQGDPLSPLLFLLIMESLHLSFQNLVNEGFGSLDEFTKSKLMGISVEDEIVSRAASKMGCCTLTTPFLYLGVKVCGSMSRIKDWDEIEAKLHSRLSKWKMKTLSSGGSFEQFMVGNDVNTKFWEDVWMGNKNFKTSFPRIYALEYDKNLTVADKMAPNDTAFSLRRQPRNGVEMEQFRALSIVIEGVLLHDMVDRWKWTFEGSGKFSVVSAKKFIDNSRLIGSPKKTRFKMVPIKVNILAWKVQFDLLPTRLNLSRRGRIMLDELLIKTRLWACGQAAHYKMGVKDVRRLLDDFFLPKSDVATRWVKCVPIKVNVFAWRVWLDRLPTRANLICRNISVLSPLCPICSTVDEDISHLLFKCELASGITRLICRWWDLSWSPMSSYSEWLSWFKNIRLYSKSKVLLEGVFYIAWWSVWNFRNHLLFSDKAPRKDVIFDDIVTRSYSWCHSRCNISFSWSSWLQHAHLISL
nr:RNA-directed DNA polymerase, eukaryota [Tanacetum cinerariifolium]